MRLVAGIFILALLIIFNNACMLPYSMMYGESSEVFETTAETTTAEWPETEEVIGNEYYFSPLAIIGGDQNNILYSGLPNQIKIYIEGSSTRHLEVTANGNSLEALDVDNGIYTFFDKHGGIAVEIVAKDVETGEFVAKVFDLVNVPAPDAYVWKYRSIFRNQMKFNAEQFKLQNAVILQHDNIKVPALCGAISYTIVRIDGNGKRYAHENVNKRGEFDTETRKLVDAAKKDDIYIFKAIKANCTAEKIKDIVYVIE